MAYGKTLYGLFILSTSLATSLTFLDFGAGKSMIKYTAEYMVDKDKNKFQSSLNTAISINLVSLIFVSIICMIIVANVSSFFKIEASNVENARTLFLIAILSTLFTFLDFIPSNILQGAGIFHERNMYQTIIIIFNIALIFWVIYSKPSIVLFGWANVFLYGLNYFIDFFLVRVKGILKGISLKIIINKKLFKQSSFSYTKDIFLLALVGFFSTQADKFIIGSVISVSAVTIYTVITRPFFLLKSLSANVYSVLQPQIIRIKSTNGDLSRFIIRISVIIFGTYLFVLAGFIVTGKEFFEVWLKTSEYNEYFSWAVLAVFNWSLTGFFGIIYRTMFVTGDTRKILGIDSYAALLNGVLSVVLTYLLGFQGVIIGTTVQMLIICVFLFKTGNFLYGIKINQILNKNLAFFISMIFLLLSLSGYLSQWTFKSSLSIIAIEIVPLLIAFIFFLYRENFLYSFNFLSKKKS